MEALEDAISHEKEALARERQLRDDRNAAAEARTQAKSDLGLRLATMQRERAELAVSWRVAAIRERRNRRAAWRVFAAWRSDAARSAAARRCGNAVLQAGGDERGGAATAGGAQHVDRTSATRGSSATQTQSSSSTAAVPRTLFSPSRAVASRSRPFLPVGMHRVLAAWRAFVQVNAARRERVIARSAVRLRFKQTRMAFSGWRDTAHRLACAREAELMAIVLREEKRSADAADHHRRIVVLSQSFLTWYGEVTRLARERREAEAHQDRRAKMAAFLERAQQQRTEPEPIDGRPADAITMAATCEGEGGETRGDERDGEASIAGSSPSSSSSSSSSSASPSAYSPSVTSVTSSTSPARLTPSRRGGASRLRGRGGIAQCDGGPRPSPPLPAFVSDMERRAAKRAAQRTALKDRYADQEKAKVEREAMAAEEALSHKAAARWAEAARRTTERAERATAEAEGAARRERALAVRSLATHCRRRALLKYGGLLPWCRLVQQARKHHRVAVSHSRFTRVARCLYAWRGHVARVRRAETIEAIRLEARAASFRKHAVVRRCWRQWASRGTQLDALAMRAGAMGRRNTLAAGFRAWSGFWARCRLRHHEQYESASEVGDKVLRRRLFARWRRATPLLKEERHAVGRRGEIMDRVRGWLTDLDPIGSGGDGGGGGGAF